MALALIGFGKVGIGVVVEDLLVIDGGILVMEGFGWIIGSCNCFFCCTIWKF